MKRTCFVILLFLLFKTTAFCQGTVLLSDDFKNNKNGWQLHNDSNFRVEIKKGFLHLEKLEKNFIRRGCLWYNKPIAGLNTLKDFSITFFARYISGGDHTEMIDVQWGTRVNNPRGVGNSSLYQLSFLMSNGEIKLDYFNKNWTYFVRKNVNAATASNKFNSREINKYELEQKDGFITLKINDQEYFRHTSNPIAGNSIGFQQCLKSAWEIDKIIVKQLENSIEKTMTPDTTVRIVSIPIAGNQPKEEGLKVYPNPFTNYVTAELNLEKEEIVLITLFDINGTKLQQHNRTLPKGNQRIQLYADVVPGTYIIKVQAGKEKELEATVIKQ